MRIQKTPFGSHPFKRGIAVIITALFLSTNVLHDAPPALAKNAAEIPVQGGSPLARDREIRIPPELGKIDEVYRGERETGNGKREDKLVSRSPFPVPRHDRMVVFIQDAHDSLEAQENIAKIIEHLVANYGVKTVFEEGYEGPVPTDKYFGFIKDPAIKEKVAYFLMDHLRIGGAEYAHINRAAKPPSREKGNDERATMRSAFPVSRSPRSDWRLIGADSLELHKENIGQYRLSAAKKDAITQDLKALEREVKSLADSRFPKEFKEWLKTKEQFDAKKMDLFTYLARTMSLAGSVERGADRRLNPERSTLYADGLLRFLVEAVKTNDPVVIEKAKHIDAREVFAELIKLEKAVAETYLGDSVERIGYRKNSKQRLNPELELFEYYKTLRLLNRLNELQVSQEEYESLLADSVERIENRQNTDLERLDAPRSTLNSGLAVDTQGLAEFIHKHTGKPLVLSKMWERNIREAVRFYEIAAARDETVSKCLNDFLTAGNGERETGNETEEKTEKRETKTLTVSRSPNPDTRTAVLVYGGFHKEAIKRILEAKHISYLVVSPRITKPSPRHEAFYKRLMTDGVHPFERTILPATAACPARVFETPVGPAEIQAAYYVLLANPNADLGTLDRRISERVQNKRPEASGLKPQQQERSEVRAEISEKDFSQEQIRWVRDAHYWMRQIVKSGQSRDIVPIFRKNSLTNSLRVYWLAADDAINRFAALPAQKKTAWRYIKFSLLMEAYFLFQAPYFLSINFVSDFLNTRSQAFHFLRYILINPIKARSEDYLKFLVRHEMGHLQAWSGWEDAFAILGYLEDHHVPFEKEFIAEAFPSPLLRYVLDSSGNEAVALADIPVSIRKAEKKFYRHPEPLMRNMEEEARRLIRFMEPWGVLADKLRLKRAEKEDYELQTFNISKALRSVLRSYPDAGNPEKYELAKKILLSQIRIQEEQAGKTSEPASPRSGAQSGSRTESGSEADTVRAEVRMKGDLIRRIYQNLGVRTYRKIFSHFSFFRKFVFDPKQDMPEQIKEFKWHSFYWMRTHAVSFCGAAGISGIFFWLGVVEENASTLERLIAFGIGGIVAVFAVINLYAVMFQLYNQHRVSRILDHLKNKPSPSSQALLADPGQDQRFKARKDDLEEIIRTAGRADEDTIFTAIVTAYQRGQIRLPVAVRGRSSTAEPPTQFRLAGINIPLQAFPGTVDDELGASGPRGQPYVHFFVSSLNELFDRKIPATDPDSETICQAFLGAITVHELAETLARQFISPLPGEDAHQIGLAAEKKYLESLASGLRQRVNNILDEVESVRLRRSRASGGASRDRHSERYALVITAEALKKTSDIHDGAARSEARATTPPTPGVYKDGTDVHLRGGQGFPADADSRRSEVRALVAALERDRNADLGTLDRRIERKEKNDAGISKLDEKSVMHVRFEIRGEKIKKPIWKRWGASILWTTLGVMAIAAVLFALIKPRIYYFSFGGIETISGAFLPDHDPDLDRMSEFGFSFRYRKIVQEVRTGKNGLAIIIKDLNNVLDRVSQEKREAFLIERVNQLWVALQAYQREQYTKREFANNPSKLRVTLEQIAAFLLEPIPSHIKSTALSWRIVEIKLQLIDIISFARSYYPNTGIEAFIDQTLKALTEHSEELMNSGVFSEYFPNVDLTALANQGIHEAARTGYASRQFPLITHPALAILFKEIGMPEDVERFKREMKSLEEAPVHYFQATAIERIKAIRKFPESLIPHIQKSAALYGLPPRVLILLAMNATPRTFPISSGLLYLQARGVLHPMFERFVPAIRLSAIGHYEFTPQAMDFISGVLAGGKNTMGIMQVRPSWVRQYHAWERRGINAYERSNRSIAWDLTDDGLNIEAGAAILKGIIKDVEKFRQTAAETGHLDPKQFAAFTKESSVVYERQYDQMVRFKIDELLVRQFKELPSPGLLGDEKWMLALAHPFYHHLVAGDRRSVLTDYGSAVDYYPLWERMRDIIHSGILDNKPMRILIQSSADELAVKELLSDPDPFWRNVAKESLTSTEKHPHGRLAPAGRRPGGDDEARSELRALVAALEQDRNADLGTLDRRVGKQVRSETRNGGTGGRQASSAEFATGDHIAQERSQSEKITRAVAVAVIFTLYSVTLIFPFQTLSFVKMFTSENHHNVWVMLGGASMALSWRIAMRKNITLFRKKGEIIRNYFFITSAVFFGATLSAIAVYLSRQTNIIYTELCILVNSFLFLFTTARYWVWRLRFPQQTSTATATTTERHPGGNVGPRSEVRSEKNHSGVRNGKEADVTEKFKQALDVDRQHSAYAVDTAKAIIKKAGSYQPVLKLAGLFEHFKAEGLGRFKYLNAILHATYSHEDSEMDFPSLRDAAVSIKRMEREIKKVTRRWEDAMESFLFSVSLDKDIRKRAAAIATNLPGQRMIKESVEQKFVRALKKGQFRDKIFQIKDKIFQTNEDAKGGTVFVINKQGPYWILLTASHVITEVGLTGDIALYQTTADSPGIGQASIVLAHSQRRTPDNEDIALLVMHEDDAKIKIGSFKAVVPSMQDEGKLTSIVNGYFTANGYLVAGNSLESLSQLGDSGSPYVRDAKPERKELEDYAVVAVHSYAGPVGAVFSYDVFQNMLDALDHRESPFILYDEDRDKLRAVKAFLTQILSVQSETRLSTATTERHPGGDGTTPDQRRETLNPSKTRGERPDSKKRAEMRATPPPTPGVYKDGTDVHLRGGQGFPADADFRRSEAREAVVNEFLTLVKQRPTYAQAIDLLDSHRDAIATQEVLDQILNWVEVSQAGVDRETTVRVIWRLVHANPSLAKGTSGAANYQQVKAFEADSNPAVAQEIRTAAMSFQHANPDLARAEARENNITDKAAVSPKAIKERKPFSPLTFQSKGGINQSWRKTVVAVFIAFIFASLLAISGYLAYSGIKMLAESKKAGVLRTEKFDAVVKKTYSLGEIRSRIPSTHEIASKRQVSESFAIDQDILNSDAAEFINSAISSPVEIGFSIVVDRRKGKTHRIITVGEIGTINFISIPPGFKETLRVHTHNGASLPTPILDFGFAEGRDDFVLVKNLGLFKCVTGAKPISSVNSAYRVIIDGKKEELFHSFYKGVEPRVNALIQAGANLIEIIYPGGNRAIFDRTLTLEKEMARLVPLSRVTERHPGGDVGPRSGAQSGPRTESGSEADTVRAEVRNFQSVRQNQEDPFGIEREQYLEHARMGNLPEGLRPFSNSFEWPMDMSVVTRHVSNFFGSRSFPTWDNVQNIRHDAIDLQAEPGTPVQAIEDGVVVFVPRFGRDGGSKKVGTFADVWIYSPASDLLWCYIHLEKDSIPGHILEHKWFDSGSDLKVKKGEMLGKVNTWHKKEAVLETFQLSPEVEWQYGRTYDHLHLEVRKVNDQGYDGSGVEHLQAINPLLLLRPLYPLSAATGRRPEGDVQQRSEMRGLKTLLAERFAKGHEISFIDLDTGLGAFIPAFKKFLEAQEYRVKKAVGTEPLRAVIAKAAASVRPDIVHANAQFPEEFSRFGTQSFDIVTIHNIESAPWALAKRARELLKPEGVLWVTLESEDVKEGREAAIVSQLKQAGFEVTPMPLPSDYPSYETLFESTRLLVATLSQGRSEIRDENGSADPDFENLLEAIKKDPRNEHGTKNKFYDFLKKAGSKEEFLKMKHRFALEFYPRTEAELESAKNEIFKRFWDLDLMAPLERSLPEELAGSAGSDFTEYTERLKTNVTTLEQAVIVAHLLLDGINALNKIDKGLFGGWRFVDVGAPDGSVVIADGWWEVFHVTSPFFPQSKYMSFGAGFATSARGIFYIHENKMAIETSQGLFLLERTRDGTVHVKREAFGVTGGRPEGEVRSEARNESKKGGSSLFVTPSTHVHLRSGQGIPTVPPQGLLGDGSVLRKVRAEIRQESLWEKGGLSRKEKIIVLGIMLNVSAAGFWTVFHPISIVQSFFEFAQDPLFSLAATAAGLAAVLWGQRLLGRVFRPEMDRTDRFFYERYVAAKRSSVPIWMSMLFQSTIMEIFHRWFFFSVLQAAGISGWDLTVLFLSSLWFSAVHVNTGWAGAVGRWWAGMVFGGLFLYFGSLFPSVSASFLASRYGYYKLKERHEREAADAKAEAGNSQRSEVRSKTYRPDAVPTGTIRKDDSSRLALPTGLFDDSAESLDSIMSLLDQRFSSTTAQAAPLRAVLYHGVDLMRQPLLFPQVLWAHAIEIEQKGFAPGRLNDWEPPSVKGVWWWVNPSVQKEDMKASDLPTFHLDFQGQVLQWYSVIFDIRTFLAEILQTKFPNLEHDQKRLKELSRYLIQRFFLSKNIDALQRGNELVILNPEKCAGMQLLGKRPAAESQPRVPNSEQPDGVRGGEVHDQNRSELRTNPVDASIFRRPNEAGSKRTEDSGQNGSMTLDKAYNLFKRGGFLDLSHDLDKSRQMAELILRQDKPAIHKVLIVGNAQSYLPVLLALIGKEVTFVDLEPAYTVESPMLIAKIKLKKRENFDPKIHIIQEEIGHLKLENHGLKAHDFDLVTMIDLVGGIPVGSPKQWLLKAKELLKPDGYIVVDVWREARDTIVRYFPDIFPQARLITRGIGGTYNLWPSNWFYQIGQHTRDDQANVARSEMRAANDPKNLFEGEPRPSEERREDEELVPELNRRIILNKRTGQIRRHGTGPVVRPEFTLLAERHGETYANSKLMLQGQKEAPVTQLTPRGLNQAEEGAGLLLRRPEIETAIEKGEKIVLATSALQRTKDSAAPFARLFKQAGGIFEYASGEVTVLGMIKNFFYKILGVITGRILKIHWLPRSLVSMLQKVHNFFIHPERLSWEIMKGANEMDSGSGNHKSIETMSEEEQKILLGIFVESRDATLKFEGGESFLELLIRAKEWLDRINELYPGRTVVLFGHGMFLMALKVLLGDPEMVDETGHIRWIHALMPPNSVPILLSTGRRPAGDVTDGHLGGGHGSRRTEMLHADKAAGEGVGSSEMLPATTVAHLSGEKGKSETAPGTSGTGFRRSEQRAEGELQEDARELTAGNAATPTNYFKNPETAYVELMQLLSGMFSVDELKTFSTAIRRKNLAENDLYWANVFDALIGMKEALQNFAPYLFAAVKPLAEAILEQYNGLFDITRRIAKITEAAPFLADLIPERGINESVTPHFLFSWIGRQPEVIQAAQMLTRHINSSEPILEKAFNDKRSGKFISSVFRAKVGRNSGSAFMVRVKNGLCVLLTAGHVVQKAGEVELWTNEEKPRKIGHARVIIRCNETSSAPLPKRDLAILVIEENIVGQLLGHKPQPIPFLENFDEGEAVVTLGGFDYEPRNFGAGNGNVYTQDSIGSGLLFHDPKDGNEAVIIRGTSRGGMSGAPILVFRNGRWKAVSVLSNYQEYGVLGGGMFLTPDVIKDISGSLDSDAVISNRSNFIKSGHDPADTEAVRAYLRDPFSAATAATGQRLGGDVIFAKFRSDPKNRAEAREISVQQMVKWMAQVPYEPEWFDEAAMSKAIQLTPRQIIANSAELVVLIKELESLVIQRKKYDTLILAHTVLTKSPERDAAAIIKNQRFDWGKIPVRPDGKSIYARKIDRMETSSARPGRLNLKLTGNILPGIFAEHVWGRFQDFANTHLKNIRRKPSAHDSQNQYLYETTVSLAAYLFDLFMQMNEISAIDYTDEKGEVLIKDQTGITISSVSLIRSEARKNSVNSVEGRGDREKPSLPSGRDSGLKPGANSRSELRTPYTPGVAEGGSNVHLGGGQGFRSEIRAANDPKNLFEGEPRPSEERREFYLSVMSLPWISAGDVLARKTLNPSIRNRNLFSAGIEQLADVLDRFARGAKGGLDGFPGEGRVAAQDISDRVSALKHLKGQADGDAGAAINKPPVANIRTSREIFPVNGLHERNNNIAPGGRQFVRSEVRDKNPDGGWRMADSGKQALRHPPSASLRPFQKAMSAQVFRTPEERARFAGNGKVAKAGEPVELAWLPLTDHIEVEFVPRAQLDPKDLFKAETRPGDGNDTIYRYRLPEDMTLGETLGFIQAIRALPDGITDSLFLPEFVRQFMDTAVLMAKLAMTQAGEINTAQAALINGFYGIGLSLAKETVEVTIPELQAIAEEPLREGMDREIFSFLGLKEEEIARFKEAFRGGQDAGESAEKIDALDLEDKAVRLAVESVMIELKALTYFRGMKLYQEHLNRKQREPVWSSNNFSGLKNALRNMGQSLLRRIKKTKRLDAPALKEAITQAKKEHGENSKEAVRKELDALAAVLESLSRLSGWVKSKGKIRMALESSPAWMKITDELNCLGRSALTDLYLEQLGIEMWVVDVLLFQDSPKAGQHALVLVRLSDGKYYWLNSLTAKWSIHEASLGVNKIPVEGTMLNTPEDPIVKRIKIRPSHRGILAGFYNNLGIALRAEKDLDGAIAAYREAIRLDTENPKTHSNLGVALCDKGDLKNGIAELLEAIRLNPDSLEAHNNLGNFLQAGGDSNGAIEAYQKVLRLDRTDAVAHYNLGMVLFLQGELVAARKHFKKFLKYAENDPELAPYIPQAQKMIEGLNKALAEFNAPPGTVLRERTVPFDKARSEARNKSDHRLLPSPNDLVRLRQELEVPVRSETRDRSPQPSQIAQTVQTMTDAEELLTRQYKFRPYAEHLFRFERLDAPSEVVFAPLSVTQGVYFDGTIEDHEKRPGRAKRWGRRDKTINILRKEKGLFIRLGEYAIADNALREIIPQALHKRIVFLSRIEDQFKDLSEGLDHALPYLAQIYEAREVFQGANVLEFGIGRGIAALLAVKLGAKQVVGIEKDAALREELQKEMALNGMTDEQIVFVEGDFTDSQIISRLKDHGPFKMGMGNIGPHKIYNKSAEEEPGPGDGLGQDGSNLEALELFYQLRKKDLLTDAFHYIGAGFSEHMFGDKNEGHYGPGGEIGFLRNHFSITDIHTAIFRKFQNESKRLFLFNSYRVALTSREGPPGSDLYEGYFGNIRFRDFPPYRSEIRSPSSILHPPSVLTVGNGIKELLNRIYGTDEKAKNETLELINRFLASNYGPAMEVKREVDALTDGEKIALARQLIADPEIASGAATEGLSLEQLLLFTPTEADQATAAVNHIFGKFLLPFLSDSAWYKDFYEQNPDALGVERVEWKTVYALLWSAELLSARSEARLNPDSSTAQPASEEGRRAELRNEKQDSGSGITESVKAGSISQAPSVLTVGNGIRGFLDRLYGTNEKIKNEILELINNFLASNYGPAMEVKREVDVLSDEEKIALARRLIADPESAPGASSDGLSLEQLLLFTPMETDQATNAARHIFVRFLLPFGPRSAWYRDFYEQEPDSLNKDRSRWKFVYALLWSAELLSARYPISTTQGAAPSSLSPSLSALGAGGHHPSSVVPGEAAQAEMREGQVFTGPLEQGQFNGFTYDPSKRILLTPEGYEIPKVFHWEINNFIFHTEEGRWKGIYFRLPTAAHAAYFEKHSLEKFKDGAAADVAPPSAMIRIGGTEFLVVRAVEPVLGTRSLQDLLSMPLEERYVQTVLDLFRRMVRSQFYLFDPKPENMVVGYLDGKLGAWLVDADLLLKRDLSPQDTAVHLLSNMNEYDSEWSVNEAFKGRVASLLRDLSSAPTPSPSESPNSKIRSEARDVSGAEKLRGQAPFRDSRKGARPQLSRVPSPESQDLIPSAMRLTKAMVFVVEKARIVEMEKDPDQAAALLRWLLGFAKVNKDMLQILLPDDREGPDSLWVEELKKCGASVYGDIRNVQKSKDMTLFGFSDAASDHGGAFLERLRSKGISGKVLCVDAAGGKGLVLAALLGRKIEELPKTRGFHRDAAGRYRAELRAAIRAFFDAYVVISRAA